jgi:glycerol kinase
MTEYILAIDQGTTGSTAVLVSKTGAVLAKANREFPQHFPKPGWVEHDLNEIWQSVGDAVTAALASAEADPRECVAIGITNQRETTVLWERSSGEPVHRAIVWQDRRTADMCERLKPEEAYFRERTGLVLDPYFSGTKLRWLLEHLAGAERRAIAGELAFGTIDSWLVHRLSGGAAHVTDATNASRTLLFDIRSGQWDDGLLERLQVPRALLPEVRSSAEVYARTKGLAFLPDGIPISGMAGDQQAALFGQTCFSPGEAKCTYGTGAFLLMNIGKTPVLSQNGLLTTVAWKLGGELTYALEGSSFIAGAAVQWLRDGLGILKSAKDIEALARTVPESGDVVFVPALAGLGAPYWDPHARGLIYGLTRDSNAGHLARATLEGIAFQIHDLVTAMGADAKRSLGRLRVDGGAARNDLLMQFQSDILDAEIDRPASVETTAIGAAYLAALGVGVFESLDEIRRAHSVERTFRPAMDEQSRRAHITKWSRAVARTRSSVRGAPIDD